MNYTDAVKFCAIRALYGPFRGFFHACFMLLNLDLVIRGKIAGDDHE